MDYRITIRLWMSQGNRARFPPISGLSASSIHSLPRREFPLAAEDLGARAVESDGVIPPGHDRQAIGNLAVAAACARGSHPCRPGSWGQRPGQLRGSAHQGLDADRMKAAKAARIEARVALVLSRKHAPLAQNRRQWSAVRRYVSGPSSPRTRCRKRHSTFAPRGAPCPSSRWARRKLTSRIARE